MARGFGELDGPQEHGAEPGSPESGEPVEHESEAAHVENGRLDNREQVEDAHPSVVHPAHNLTFVLGRLLPFLGILYCVTYLTQIVVIHLHRRERQLLREMKERELMEAQLVQAGKLAAIGELAGNLAHEVNNPVAVISGSVVSPGERVKGYRVARITQDTVELEGKNEAFTLRLR